MPDRDWDYTDPDSDTPEPDWNDWDKEPAKECDDGDHDYGDWKKGK